jgi:Tol biopolymer transport system component
MPNIFVPPWQIEGLATYVESATTGRGRVPAGDFRLLLDRAAGGRRFASLDRASSSRVDWPSGQTPYLYGAYFHQYLAERYGESSLVRLADATAGRVPYLGSRAFRNVFDKPLGELWTAFERDTESRSALPADAATRLTHHGFTVSAPAFAADGRLYYALSDPHDFPAVMVREPDGGARQLTRRVGGGQLSATGDRLVFDQAEFVRSVGVQGDLYVADRVTGESRRLTREARAGDPDVSPDGRTIVFTVQDAERRFLATLPLAASGEAPQPLLSEPGDHYASPRWSPDGRYIAVELRHTGGPSTIAIIDYAGRAVVATISAPGSHRNLTPSWTRDGRSVLFAAEGGEGPFRVYLAHLQSGRVRVLANAAGGGQSPVQSPDGRTLVFVGLTAGGYDLFSIGWDRAEWSDTAEPSAPGVVRSALGPVLLDPGGPRIAEYKPWRSLVPRFWTPIVEIDDDETSIGAATSSADALGRHAYAAGAAWSTRARPDWYFSYAYDRWRPTWFADISDDTDPWRDGTIRTREINAGLTVPFRTFRRMQRVFGSLHASADEVTCATCDTPVALTMDRRALRGGWSFTTAKSYGFSISSEDGVSASVAAEWSPEAFGSTGTSRAAIADVRAFLPLFPRHGVLALRGAAASSWGDENAVRTFGAGGSGPLFVGASFDRDAVGLIRGFETGDAVGTHAAVLNADYRVPLVWIERGAGTLPVLLRSLHGALFADAGAAWTTRYTRDARRASVGFEVSADIVVGYSVPFTLASGVAWRHDPTGRETGAALFARVGRAF